jgi:hypothetical protein
MAAPMERDAPVTMATLPCSVSDAFMMLFLFVRWVGEASMAAPFPYR